VRRCQVNALKAMCPELDPDQSRLPRGAIDLGGGYILLRAKDDTFHETSGASSAAIRTYMGRTTLVPSSWRPLVKRWARLHLPNGQIARSAWKEPKSLTKVRMSRNVKVSVPQ
jgi:hypothetical protein